jgi:hypothetical protein
MVELYVHSLIRFQDMMHRKILPFLHLSQNLPGGSEEKDRNILTMASLWAEI